MAMSSRKRPANTPADDNPAAATTPATGSRPRWIDRINVDVGGTIFTTSVSTLTGASVYFQHMFSDRWQDQPQETLFLDRDPQPFAILLGYMRSGSLELPEADLSLSRRVLLEAEYLGCERLLVEVKATAMRNSRPDSSNDVIPSPSDDAEAAAEFDAKYGSLQQALRERVLPERYFGVAPARAPAKKPKVLQLLPANCTVKIGSTHNEDGQSFACHCLLLMDSPIELPGDQDHPPTGRDSYLDAYITDPSNYGTVRASEAFGEMTTWLEFSENVDSEIILPIKGVRASFWKDATDHSKGFFEREVPLLRRFVDEDGNPRTSLVDVSSLDDDGGETPDGYHRLKDVRTWGNFRSLVTDPQPDS